MIVRSYNPIERGQPAVWIEGTIDGDGDVQMIRRRLREYPDGDGPIDVVMNGGGGNTGRGLEVYTALREHPRAKRVTILSAPSMGGVIAMAGDHIRIVEGGTIFLHPVGYSSDFLVNSEPAMRHVSAVGLRLLARQCEVTDALHLDIFARRTGLSRAAIADLRAVDTTLEAHEAVRLGFADEVVHAGP